MKKLYDDLSFEVSKSITKKYSTSFSLGILALKPTIRPAIYAIYGLVRLADEIVDSFHDFNKEELLLNFKKETFTSIQNKISTNPIVQSFQETVHQYQIDLDLIQQFFHSMEMDLHKIQYNSDKYKEYIYGSAEVVGLMCLHVFTEGNKTEFEKLKPYAMKLGSAFQKVNFLRDLKDDYQTLGRSYFPNVDMEEFNTEIKIQLEQEINQEFKEALVGIKMLPKSSRFGVYLAYKYYLELLNKIRKTNAEDILVNRIRVPNYNKATVMMKSYVRFKVAIL